MQVRFLSDAFRRQWNEKPFAAFCICRILWQKGFDMKKEKLLEIRDYIIKHCKVVFPILILVIAAVTVAVALGARKEKAALASSAAEESSIASEAESTAEGVVEDVPLSANEDSAIYTLMATYYNALATGDTDTILSVCNEYSENELLRLSERSKYLDYYPTLELYTKPGPEDGSTVVYVYYKLVFLNHEEEVPGFQAWYVCTDENGELYINTSELAEDVDAYVTAVSTQDDVVELYNKVNVEYNEVVTEHPELLTYMQELSTEVNTAVGTVLAQENSSEEGTTSESEEGQKADNSDTTESNTTEEPVVTETQYATATTTVNVRSSDSEQADKLGKVSSGTKLEVQEVRVNGWTKVVYEGKDGFIKSEFLQMAESAASLDVIGTVVATTNINVRSSASESADRLGVLTGGESVDLLAEEGDWYRINYSGQVGYIKAEYATKQ